MDWTLRTENVPYIDHFRAAKVRYSRGSLETTVWGIAAALTAS